MDTRSSRGQGAAIRRLLRRAPSPTQRIAIDDDVNARGFPEHLHGLRNRTVVQMKFHRLAQLLCRLRVQAPRFVILHDGRYIGSLRCAAAIASACTLSL